MYGLSLSLSVIRFRCSLFWACRRNPTRVFKAEAQNPLRSTFLRRILGALGTEVKPGPVGPEHLLFVVYHWHMEQFKCDNQYYKLAVVVVVAGRLRRPYRRGRRSGCCRRVVVAAAVAAATGMYALRLVRRRAPHGATVVSESSCLGSVRSGIDCSNSTN